MAGFLLAVLGVIAGMLVDTVEVVAPEVPGSCGQPSGPVIAPSRWQAAFCDFSQYFTDPQTGKPAKDAPPVGLELKETDQATFSATVTVDLAANHPLADRARRGELAARPQEFVQAVCGLTFLNEDESVQWSRPVLSDAGNGRLRIVSTAVSSQPPPTNGLTEFSVYINSPGTVTITSRTLDIVGVRRDYGDFTNVQVLDHSAVVQSSSSDALMVSLSNSTAAPIDTAPLMSVPEQVFQVLNAGQSALGQVGSSLLVTVPWLALIVANTTGLFGRLGRTLAWRRAMTVTSGVLVVHLGVITASALSHVESAFTQVASSSNLSFWLLHTLGWHAGTTPAVGGAVVVLMALLVVVLATIGEWPVLRSLRSPRAAGPVVGLHAVATVPVVLFVVCIVCDVFIAILPRWLLSVQQTQASPNEWLASKLPWFAVLAIVVVAVGAAVILAVYRRSIDPAWSLPVAGALVAGLALLATVHSNEGWLPWALRWAGWGAAGTVAVLATVSLFFYAVIGARPPRRMALWSVPLTALLITIWMVPTGASVGWWQVQPLMVRLDGITGLAIVTAVVAALRRLGRRHPVRQQDLRASRVLGIGLAYIVITVTYSMIATPSLPLLLVGAIMAWVLFPRAAVARTEEILRQPDGRHAAAVRSIVRAGTARRTLVVLRKTTRDKVASGDWTPQRAQQLTEDIEHTAAEETPADTTGCAGLRDRAFGYSFTRRPSIRAGWTLRVAGILGAPWMILAVVGAAHKIGQPTNGFAVLAAVGAITPHILRWLGYGLLFGYFYPLVRGRTGLTKGTWLFLAIATPTVIDTLAHPSTTGWSGILLPAVQDFAFALTLGFLADREVLIRQKLSSARLADVHNLGSVAAWGSSIALALATGIATIIIGGLQPFVIGVIHLPATPTPPAVVNPTAK